MNINNTEERNLPRSLSREATQEILGDNLYLLLAIGKNGQITRFYPNGVELPTEIIEFSDEVDEEKITVDICLQIPKSDLNVTLPENPGMQPMMLRSRRRCCDVGGKNTGC